MSIDASFIAQLNPHRAVAERPATDALMEMKMLKELGAVDTKMLGPDAEGYMNILMKNELQYVRLAIQLLMKSNRIADALGGRTYGNVAKLTSIIKQRADQRWVERFFDDSIFQKSVAARPTADNDELFALDKATFVGSWTDWKGSGVGADPWSSI
jgi:hypothetical protein